MTELNKRRRRNHKKTDANAERIALTTKKNETAADEFQSRRGTKPRNAM